MNLPSFDHLRILVIGDIMLDRYLHGTSDRLSGEAPVPIAKIERESYSLGGAANVAANLRGLGVKTALVGCLGHDEHGVLLRHLIEAAGIEFPRPFYPTQSIVKTRVMANRQQVCRFDYEGTPDQYCIDEHLKWLAEYAAPFDAIILSDYAKGVVSQEVLEAVTRLGKFVALDPKPKNKLHYTGLSLLTPNHHEAAELFKDGYMQLAENVLITCGADGMRLIAAGWENYQPAEARSLVDVTGAGDTVISVMTAALVSGMGAVDAMKLASKAAGVVVGKPGTVAITRADLLAET